MNKVEFNLGVVQAIFDELAVFKIAKKKDRVTKVKSIRTILKDYEKPNIYDFKELRGAYYAIEVIHNTCKLYLFDCISYRQFHIISQHHTSIVFDLLLKIKKK